MATEGHRHFFPGDLAIAVSDVHAEGVSRQFLLKRSEVVKISFIGSGSSAGWVHGEVLNPDRPGLCGWLPASELMRTPTQICQRVAALKCLPSWQDRGAAYHGYLAPVSAGELLDVHHYGNEASDDKGWAYVSRVSKPHERGWVPDYVLRTSLAGETPLVSSVSAAVNDESVTASANVNDENVMESELLASTQSTGSTGRDLQLLPTDQAVEISRSSQTSTDEPTHAYHARPDRVPSRLRQAPETNTEFVAGGHIADNEMLQVLSSIEGWTQVRTAGGHTGWVRSNYIKDVPMPARVIATGREDALLDSSQMPAEDLSNHQLAVVQSSVTPPPCPQAQPICCPSVQPAPNPGHPLRKGDLVRRWKSMTALEPVIAFGGTEEADYQCFTNSYYTAAFVFVVPPEFCDMELTGEQRCVRCEFSEKAIMLCKAAAMGDSDRFWRICDSRTVRDVKQCASGICPMKKQLWETIVCSVAFEVVHQKFSQLQRLRNILEGTGDTLLADMDRDQTFGIALEKGDPSIGVPAEWRGANVMGWALMEVRDVLRGTLPFDTRTS